MRILHICQRDDPDTGGSLRVAEALVREQRKEGHDAWLLFLYGEPAAISKSLGSHTYCMGLGSSHEALSGIWALRKAIRRITPDVVHSHDGILWPRLVFLSRRIPLVMHSHLPVSECRNLKDKIGRILIRITTRSLVGISLHTIDSWVREGFPASRVHYVPNGVDFDRFPILGPGTKVEMRAQLGLPADKHIMLWVGRVHREMKGSDRVERVASLLPDGMVLVVVGHGPDFEAMQQSCQEYISAGKLILVGSTSSPEMYYQAADTFLFTSYHEPFGLVILEAVASGLPIISFPVTDGGGAVSLLEEVNAFMVEDEALDDEIRSQLQYDEGRYAQALAIREKSITKYAWSSIAPLIIDTYKLCLNRKGGNL